MHEMAIELSRVAVATRCEHTKVYSGECLELGSSTRWFYVCTGCLDTGSDGMPEAPEANPEEYWAAMRKLNPECWVPARYRV